MDVENQITELEHRIMHCTKSIQRLEKQNRLYRCAMFTVAALALVLFVGGAGQDEGDGVDTFDTIQAKKLYANEIMIWNPDGRVAIGLGSMELPEQSDDSPDASRYTGLLTLHSGNGEGNVITGVSMAIYGPKEKVGHTSISAHGLSVYGPQNKPAVEIGLTDFSNGFIITYTSEGKMLVDVTATRNADAKTPSGIVSVHNNGQRVIAIGTAEEDGEALIAAHNRAGNVYARWPRR